MKNSGFFIVKNSLKYCTSAHCVLFALMQKEPKKSRLYANPMILPEISGGTKPNSLLLRRRSNKVLSKTASDFAKSGFA
ncbi:MAG: hypothetical protein H6574_08380 [Lewinellaceae bacterium]|nr:hypothetical protein [Saprospiraceae bacterium]MCB9331083.1 hypothetical protein [Lewinellaceae bacterium]